MTTELEKLRNYPLLTKYQKTLQPNEYAALEAWLSTFYPFQLDWLLEESSLAICNKARQIGFSHTTSAVAVIWGAFHGELTTIISIGDREAIEVLEKAKRHRGVLCQLGSSMAAPTRGKRDSTNEITFTSGGRIIALPSSGGRSFTGNVFLDEYAYQEHASQVWDAAAAVTMLGHRLRVASTPNGVGNDFHELWERASEHGSKWRAHLVLLEQARAQGYPVDLDRCWELAKGDPRLFDQLFNGSFLDGAVQYIPTEAIDKCCDDLPPPADGDHYAGLDIGRDADLTVLVIVRLHRGVRHVVHLETMKRTDSDGLEAMVDRAFADFRLKRLCIDATGLGTFPAERIKQKHSERIDTSWRRPRVEPLAFTPALKDKLATGLYTALVSENVRLPKGADALRKDIASIRRMITNSGNVRYDAPRTAAGHADRAWALALALYACSAPNAMVEALRGTRRS